MTKGYTFACCLAALFVLAACGGGPAPSAPQTSAPMADVEASAAECRSIAQDRVQNLPAVRSGRTVYVQGGPSPYYDSCMRERGFSAFPPY